MPIVGRIGEVFVNCPFDPAYQPLFDAVVFTITACGFRVRSALEVADSGDLRLRKIIGLIERSGLSIHDISRVNIDPKTKLPRFNMPVELGIALGMKYLGRRALRDHRMLVLDTERFRYRDSASDLAGLDISAHRDDPETLIGAIRNFLAANTSAHLPTDDVLFVLYQAFQTDLPKLAADVRQTIDKLTYTDRLRHLNSFLAKVT